MSSEPLANDDAGPFSIGQSAVWPGLAKLIEECGEVVQVGGKLIATFGSENHWSGRNLRRDIEDEIADVLAACAFVASECCLDTTRIERRRLDKLGIFHRWHGDEWDGYRKVTW